LANGSPILGDSKVPVTLVEFGDYQCNFCNVFFHTTEDKIVQNYVKLAKSRLFSKILTLLVLIQLMHHTVHTANEQGLFWEYHDILYSNWTGENNGWASSENLLKFAKEINLNLDQWSDCMVNGNNLQTILASNNDAKALELTGTPSFFVIGPDGETTRLFGVQPFEKIFEIELKK